MSITKGKIKKLENSIKKSSPSESDLKMQEEFKKEYKEFENFRKTNKYKLWQKLNEKKIQEEIEMAEKLNSRNTLGISKELNDLIHEYILWREERINNNQTMV